MNAVEGCLIPLRLEANKTTTKAGLEPYTHIKWPNDTIESTVREPKEIREY